MTGRKAPRPSGVALWGHPGPELLVGQPAAFAGTPLPPAPGSDTLLPSLTHSQMSTPRTSPTSTLHLTPISDPLPRIPLRVQANGGRGCDRTRLSESDRWPNPRKRRRVAAGPALGARSVPPRGAWRGQPDTPGAPARPVDTRPQSPHDV